ncbi:MULTISPECIES: hypothetical protein [unclassified Mesorhizobium]|uniref:hypothetical protein n=1 Tax=unclassified Mesorhizobium TaxID=325217 RepID=UPI000BB0699F|nr:MULTISPECIES: hypothetical protein [unclassified Mesorhizobium]TGT56925.1 hypothetical protein EN813_041770 [Mesorhizobium sp. M00.F.Ca.ET.170.01.1.1]AZO08695.1 hypothetical protein EJ074_05865 [Mesorhizobium sp. M3A.F.Ca.ET.080.04.2.1]PBB85573.1 hypothetical protein CK216_18240 [Mesorhizobium sp. WSM3876]RWB71810.1 MAG: hypothetical protein EOQ49_15080 [Mesorhizobium sp.]RWB84937.1 MAG: hypothetical protein EOQ52_21825 [Mesorhizobium sp.]
MRFAVIQDPCDDWMVYDLLYDLPAEIAGELPVGLTREEAERLARQANQGRPVRLRALPGDGGTAIHQIRRL